MRRMLQRRESVRYRLCAPVHGKVQTSWMHAPAASFLGNIDFDRGRLFETSDLDEVRHRCARVFNPHTLNVVGHDQRLHARMEHLPLGGLSLNRLKWGAAVEVDPDRLGCYYLLSIPIKGQAVFRHVGGEIDVSPACAGLVSSDPRFRFRASADFEQIVLRIERPAVDAAWAALTGQAPTRAIDFDCGVPFAGPGWRAIEPALRALADCVRGAFEPTRLQHLTARIEDMLLTALLLHQPNASGLREPRMPRKLDLHLRRAEQFMSEHLEEPLTLGHVARACGVSRRTVQAAFQSERGVGPMQWLRQERLQAVRDALTGGREARPSVTEVALRFGFSHLGEFSKAYRSAFGETPTATLARRT